MKKAFLYAYDKVNLGDDLFIRIISERYPRVKFYLWSNKRNKLVFKRNKNIKVIDKESLFLNILGKIRPSLVARYQECIKKRCSAVIYIGGSIFMEYPNWRNIVTWWEYQADHYPFYVVGANFGPYRTEEYKKKMGLIFQKIEDICFRDKYSVQLFDTNRKIRYAPDILFSYPMQKVEIKQEQVFISVINCEKKEDGKYAEFKDSYEKIIQDIAVQFIRQNLKIIFVSFCKAEGDEEVVNRLISELSNKGYGTKIDSMFYDGTNEQNILYQLAASKYVIASRFHAIILSLVAGQAVYPITYSDKSKNMLKDVGFRGRSLDLQNLNSFNLEDLEECNLSHFLLDISDMNTKSSKHFEHLDKIFYE